MRYQIVGTPWGTPYNRLYGEAPPERGPFFRLQVYERAAISLVGQPVPGSQKVGKTRKKKVSELRFLNSGNPTISEPGTEATSWSI